MPTIERTTRQERDYKREARGRHRRSLDTDLLTAIKLLAEDARLPAGYRDHALTGDWQGHRDCHIEPDLILIYRKPDLDTLQLVRLGSHSELSR